MNQRRRKRAADGREERSLMSVSLMPRATERIVILLLLYGANFPACHGFRIRHPTISQHRYPLIPKLCAADDNHELTENLRPVNGTTATLPARSSTRLSETTSHLLCDKKAFVSASEKKAHPSVTAVTRVPKTPKYNLQLLLIDHYDSFTYNLYDMLAQLCEKPPIVLAKDAFDDWSQLAEIYGPSAFDGVILSPGPGTPTNPQDIGTLSPSIIRQNRGLPILGVCLGHQILGHVYGAKVDLCGPVHGQVRTIEQQARPTSAVDVSEKDPLWKDIPPRFSVTRYHSLAVTLPGAGVGHLVPLRATAYSAENQPDNKILMGLSHKDNPHFGVQFHPESIGSEYGHQLLKNFCDICQSRSNNKKGKNDGESPLRINGFSTKWNQHNQRTSRPKGDDRLKETLNGPNGTNGDSPFIHDTGSTNGVAPSVGLVETDSAVKAASRYKAFVHKVAAPDCVSPLQVFEEFLAKAPYSAWLDTSRGVQSNLCTLEANADTAESYCSILGAGNRLIEYFGKEYDAKLQGLFCHDLSTGRSTKLPHEDIFSFLHENHNNATESVTMVSFQDHSTIALFTSMDDGRLPFDFRGGHVGYLGYEVRHDSERFLEEQERGSHRRRKPDDSLLSPQQPKAKQNSKGTIPTAAFLFLEKSWVYDHSNNNWYLVCLVDQLDDGRDTKRQTEEALEWMRTSALRILNLNQEARQISDSSSFLSTMNENQFGDQKDSATIGVEALHNSVSRSTTALQPVLKFIPNRSRSCYNQNFADCQEQIRLGESYELCLTNQLEARVCVPTTATPLELYKILRKRNPAPFSAYFNWNALYQTTRLRESDVKAELPSMAICCSSPERFISVKRKRMGDGRLVDGSSRGTTELEVEAKPIKGTCARVLPEDISTGLSTIEAVEDERRARNLKASVKNQAENLMIVDLLRNDLSRVCEVGSVHVSKLMDIESYATVHQMVSTIRGRLNPSKANAVDVLKATFPGGSMTGAPKVRTMEILDRLEEGVSRGPYSGCLGYISMNGSMDMNIVIRSAVVLPTNAVSSKETAHKSSAAENHREWSVSIGAGGAITALSDRKDEYDEMILKATAVIEAVEEWAGALPGEAVRYLSDSTAEVR